MGQDLVNHQLKEHRRRQSQELHGDRSDQNVSKCLLLLPNLGDKPGKSKLLVWIHDFVLTLEEDGFATPHGLELLGSHDLHHSLGRRRVQHGNTVSSFLPRRWNHAHHDNHRAASGVGNQGENAGLGQQAFPRQGLYFGFEPDIASHAQHDQGAGLSVAHRIF